MRILTCHNFYQQGGGEDQVFAAEADLLRQHGHDVRTFCVRNDDIEGMGRLKLAAATVWNRSTAAQVRAAAAEHRAQIVHFHNTFPLLSPAVYSAATTGAAVVQTLHNYRLLCPAATLFRDGKPCQRCLGHLPLPAVALGCYRNSRLATAAAAGMLAAHRGLGTYAHQVDAYIALTRFAREKFLSAGFAPGLIHVKPNFIDPDPGEGAGAGDGGGRFALFVGRLSEEKGIVPLLAAWQRIGASLPLKICGNGPMGEIVGKAAAENSAIQWLGRRPLPEVIDLMGKAALLVFPSLWYEGFPRTIVESFARGTSVAASDLGSMKELIDPGRTGVLFSPGDPDDMARKILATASDAGVLAGLRRGARREFLTRYGAARNHALMLEIYRHAIARREEVEEPQLAAAT